MLSLSIIWLAPAALRGWGLFFSWWEAPLHASNASLKKMKIYALLLHAFLVYFFDLLLLPSGLGGLFISWCKAPLHASKASLKKIVNLCSISWFPCLFFDLILLHSGLRGLYSSWCEALLSCEQRKLENISKPLLYCMISFSIIWLAPAALRDGSLFILWCEAPFMQATWAWKFKIYALLLHAFFVYFLTWSCCPPGWGGMHISWCEAPLSCEQRELESFILFALLHAFLVYFLTWSCCPQGCTGNENLPYFRNMVI